MSEQGQPHYTDVGFLRRSADAMADAIERLVLLGRLDSRSRAADAALNYRNPAFDRLDTIERLEASIPDDIRAAGWSVAVHNDYRQGGQAHTFWLFTDGERAVKGEGPSDCEALNLVRARIGIPMRPER